MKVLIACEESQTVCKAFRALGHEAYSCDVQEPSGGHPEWHIWGDALEAVKGGEIVTMDGQRHDICKWGLPPLRPTNTVEPKGLWVGARKVSSKYTLQSNRNSKIRAKTFHGIAAAMAAQWGGDIR